MNDYPAANRQPASTARRWPVPAIATTAMAVAVIMVGACGSPSDNRDPSPGPAPSLSTGPSGSPGAEATPEATGGGEGPAGDNEGAGEDAGGDDLAPLPQPLLIEVTTSSPTSSYPCHPSGAIVVSGGNGGDSTQVGEGPEYPLHVTYQWFIRKAGPERNAVPYGLPETLQFNVAGGIPVSGPELTPAPGIEVELRVVAPETIAGGWMAHPGCA